MNKLIKTFCIFIFFIFSYSFAQLKPIYPKKYECIETYLKLKGINLIEPDILVEEKKK